MIAEVETKAGFKEWVVLELMGHRKLAGLLTEQEIAGHGFLRLDISTGVRYRPDGSSIEESVATQFYSPSSVYAITPVSERTAREFAQRHQPEPVTRWELPQLSPPTSPMDLDRDPERDREEDLPF